MASLFPLPIVAFDLMPDDQADALLETWGHFLGACRRPFGRQSFGLAVDGEILSLAVSTSTVNRRCGGHDRQEVVELARLCSHPEHAHLTRVTLRLWRTIAPTRWPHWPVAALVAYADSTRHAGDIYRFDGWRKAGDVRGGKAGPGSTWTRKREYNPKSVWCYEARPHPGGALRA